MPPTPAIPLITWPANVAPTARSGMRGQPVIDFARAAQAGDGVAGELGRPRPPAAEVAAQGEAEERVTAADRRPQRLPVVVPERLATRDAAGGAAREAGQPDVQRQVEPDDRVGA